MNIARTLCSSHHCYVRRNLYRKFRFSSANYDSSPSTQPRVQEEKFHFEDLKVLVRTHRRKEKIPPFMKNIFVSIFNRDLMAYPEILNKEEEQIVEKNVAKLENVFSDGNKTQDDRKTVLQSTKMYGAPVCWTRNGLAANVTESLRYLEVISRDFELGQQVSDHWVGLEAVQIGLTSEQYAGIVDDLISGERTITLAIKERIAERVSQADFRTSADMDGEGVWRISGEKVCNASNGYLLVLCKVEAERLKAFLVHPGAEGVSYNNNFVHFLRTPGTPLDHITEARLAQVLGLSRLYAATLCRNQLKQAIYSVVDYVRPRIFGGKPLAELSTIRSTVGDALLDVYASESAEYFTAGLLDGYEDPDAELEVAMCRNFMANHGRTSIMKLLAIPALDNELECKQLLDNMRQLATRGESLDNVNMFIALTGIQHAGKTMAEEVKQIRNPLLHPGFIFKKVFANRHQERDEPKLTLYLAEHLHPTLRQPAEQLEYCTLRMRFACETLMARHGVNAATAYTELNRLAEAATEILMMTAVLARASRAYCIGVRNAEIEMKLAACFVENTKARVKQLIREIDDGEYLNMDHFKVEFGRKVLDTQSVLVEKPTTRVFW